MKYFLVLLVVLSCSRVNTKEQEVYREKNMRHGIVPLSSPKPQKVKQSLLDESVLRGQKLYQNHCMECHGANGQGDGPMAKNQKVPPANLKQTLKEVEHFEFYLSISQLQGEMPGWKNPLDHRDREDLVNYLRSLR